VQSLTTHVRYRKLYARIAHGLARGSPTLSPRRYTPTAMATGLLGCFTRNSSFHRCAPFPFKDADGHEILGGAVDSRPGNRLSTGEASRSLGLAGDSGSAETRDIRLPHTVA